MKILLFCILLSLFACAHNVDDKTEILPKRPDCPSPLVVLPDNYIVELAAGAIVELNPARQQFALFCTVDEAKEALAADLAAKRIEGEGHWRVYSLNGSYEDLARPCGDGQVCLAVPTTVLEWVD